MSKQQVRTSYVLAFDTANTTIAIGLGILRADERSIDVILSRETEARRASNTQLLPRIDDLLSECGVDRNDIACVVVGRGPGSFTGVRIALATAKGVASALGIALVGVSSLDAVAWNARAAGIRGRLAVVADAMRKEVYPVRYDLDDRSALRRESDRVVKADTAAEQLARTGQGQEDGREIGSRGQGGDIPDAVDRLPLLITGDALDKYADLLSSAGDTLTPDLWTPTGRGLLLAAEAAWREGNINPFDACRHDPTFVLPVYTRLSDAEENERIRLAKNDPRNLSTGVQDAATRRDQRATKHDTAILNARPAADGITYKPLDAAHAGAVAALERQIMERDAWSEQLVADELPRKDRVWWAAYASRGALVGYAGGWIVDGQMQILKVGVERRWRRRGIARALLARLAADARDLGAVTCSLEVRAGNSGAQEFYGSLGLRPIGFRPHYYPDHEDALLMEGPLPLASHDVAGMELQVHDVEPVCGQKPFDDVPTALIPPLILAIETSCDETAASIINGDGRLVADVVASQVDFHARFGGVVPEIASRKHIEAICGVCDECFDIAASHFGRESLGWRDLDSVAVTYAPGLLGALVVGVAFAKGAAWGADIPFIGVNHLEGHLYANKIATPDLTPPAVVSLVSGGHTLLVHMKDWGDYETLGSTLDDAVGEAFDKVAKALGLGYPGGPIISRYAAEGDSKAIAFPRAMLHSGNLQFSLSGLKTAVVTYINQERAAGRALNVPDIAASFQQAVIDVQVAKAEQALKRTGAHEFCLGGGVAANPALRDAYRSLCDRLGVRLTLPPLSACTDNAGMIALVALDRYRAGKFFPLDADAQAHTNLDEAY